MSTFISRTDHHWTALGAYYAYQDYCRARGTEPADLEKDFTAVEYPGFLGSFYSDSGKNAALAGGDTVTAYKPNDTNSLRFTASDGSSVQWMVVSDVSTWNASSKYSCFIGGDNPWTVIENPNKTDGSTCIVVKESFGNAFVPFLVPDYQKVYVVDYRYISKVKSEKLAGSGGRDRCDGCAVPEQCICYPQRKPDEGTVFSGRITKKSKRRLSLKRKAAFYFISACSGQREYLLGELL